MAVKAKRGPKKHKAAPPSPKLKKEKTDPGPPAEALRAIKFAEEDLNKAENEHDQIKVKLREAKAKKERLRERLHEVIKEETGLEPSLYSETTKAAVQNINTASPVDDESWRTYPLKTLKIPKGTLAKLEESNIKTIGDLVDFQDPAKNDGRQNRLDMIKGIKGAAITKLEDATTEFWADWNAKKANAIIDTVAEAVKVPESDSEKGDE